MALVSRVDERCKWPMEREPMIRLQLRARLVEFFLMKRALAEAASKSQSKGSAHISQLDLARSLLATATTLEIDPDQQLASVLLLREAALLAAVASISGNPIEPEALAPSCIWAKACELAKLRTLLQSLSPLALERAETAIRSGVSPECSAWSDAEVRQLLESLKRITQELLTLAEEDAYATQRVRTRIAGRWAGALILSSLLVGGIGYRIARIGTVNLALNAYVTTSSRYLPEVYDPKKLVDGDKLAIGCHSLVDPSPWAIIDLGEEVTVRRVVVTNRPDVPAESAVPLVIDLSADGNTYKEFARRLDPFRTWTATGNATTARFVRLTIPQTAVLHLNEVEVF